MALIKIVVYTEDNKVEKDMVINDDNLFNTLYEITSEYNNEITKDNLGDYNFTSSWDDIIKVIPYDALIRYDNNLISLPHEFIVKLKASNELDTNKVTEFYVKPAEVDNYQKVAYKDANKGWIIADEAIDMY